MGRWARAHGRSVQPQCAAAVRSCSAQPQCAAAARSRSTRRQAHSGSVRGASGNVLIQTLIQLVDGRISSISAS